MNTPICDFVNNYIQKGISRFHMPGHKGISRLGCEPWDITEVEGADDLYHAEDIILQSEQNASSLFASRHTFYSTEGSSLCIRAMLYLAQLYTPDGKGAASADPPAASAPPAAALAAAPAPAPTSSAPAAPTAAPPAAPASSAAAPSAVPAFTTPARGSVSKSPRRRILAARNAHKAFLYACALLDLDVIWLYPDAAVDAPAASGAVSGETAPAHSLCSCPISPEALHRTLSSLPEDGLPCAVFVTSPDYLGGMQDIRGLAEVCHRFGLPLLVDNAHGAYLKFLEPSLHPLDLGADMCCDSAHKTLPVLTGCAYLHVSRQALHPYEENARSALSLFGSTSPSYLLLQSLDSCNALLAEDYPDRLRTCVQKKEQLCQLFHKKLASRQILLPASDPLRLVLQTLAGDQLSAARPVPTSGLTGYMLAERLRRFQAECEYADRDYLTLMLTPDNTAADWERLHSFLFSLTGGTDLHPSASGPAGSLRTPGSSNLPASGSDEPVFPIREALLQPGDRVFSIREALLAPGETVPAEQALNRICAAPAVSCPPAIPVAISGERITEHTLALCRYYGIRTLHVVKQRC